MNRKPQFNRKAFALIFGFFALFAIILFYSSREKPALQIFGWFSIICGVVGYPLFYLKEVVGLIAKAIVDWVKKGGGDD